LQDDDHKTVRLQFYILIAQYESAIILDQENCPRNPPPMSAFAVNLCLLLRFFLFTGARESILLNSGTTDLVFVHGTHQPVLTSVCGNNSPNHGSAISNASHPCPLLHDSSPCAEMAMEVLDNAERTALSLTCSLPTHGPLWCTQRVHFASRK
jgi:hypothetical protein